MVAKVRVNPVEAGALMPVRNRVRIARPWEQGGLRFGKVREISATFSTERAAVAALCPPGFRPADDPLVTFRMQQCADVDWLAGRGYNLLAVDVAASFDGERDHDVAGSLCIVIWENMTEPILTGREFSGVAKIYGEIPDPREEGGVWRVGVSRFGRPIIELSVSNLSRRPKTAQRELEAARREGNYMQYKYFPGIEDETPDVAYAAVYPSSGACVEFQSGEGAAVVHDATFEQNPTQFELVNRLAALPMLEARAAAMTRWEPAMLLDRRPRRLL